MMLDYFMVFALTKKHYLDFDSKSSKFIESALNLIENKFTGTESITA